MGACQNSGRADVYFSVGIALEYDSFSFMSANNFFLHSKCRLCLELSNHRNTCTCHSPLLCFPGAKQLSQHMGLPIPSAKFSMLFNSYYFTSQIFFKSYIFFFLCKEKRDSGRKSKSCGEYEEWKEKGIEETNLSCFCTIWRGNLLESAVAGKARMEK